MQLASRQRGTVSVTFRPKKRMPLFTAELCALVAGVRQHVLTLKGSVQGLDVRLEKQDLQFGTVVLGSHVTKQLQLINAGMHLLLPPPASLTEQDAVMLLLAPGFDCQPVVGNCSRCRWLVAK
jgi:hypothetical protein